MSKRVSEWKASADEIWKDLNGFAFSVRTSASSKLLFDDDESIGLTIIISPYFSTISAGNLQWSRAFAGRRLQIVTIPDGQLVGEEITLPNNLHRRELRFELPDGNFQFRVVST